MSPAAREAYEKWNNMRKEERLYLASLSPEIRGELKLVCTFCGTHKVGQVDLIKFKLKNLLFRLAIVIITDLVVAFMQKPQSFIAFLDKPISSC
jgi:hypothetical protein